METAVPSYLSLEHKQAEASNVIPVNMRESDEKGRDCVGSLAPFPQFELVFVWIIWIVQDVMGQHTRSRALLGHIPGERHIYCCLCMFLAAQHFDVSLQMKVGVWMSGKNDPSEAFPLLVLSSVMPWL